MGRKDFPFVETELKLFMLFHPRLADLSLPCPTTHSRLSQIREYNHIRSMSDPYAPNLYQKLYEPAVHLFDKGKFKACTKLAESNVA
jgi:hypothetical protein